MSVSTTEELRSRLDPIMTRAPLLGKVWIDLILLSLPFSPGDHCGAWCKTNFSSACSLNESAVANANHLMPLNWCVCLALCLPLHVSLFYLSRTQRLEVLDGYLSEFDASGADTGGSQVQWQKKKSEPWKITEEFPAGEDSKGKSSCEFFFQFRFLFERLCRRRLGETSRFEHCILAFKRG